MATNKDDDMGRSGNRSTPQGSAQGNPKDQQGNQRLPGDMQGKSDSTSQGQGGNFNQGTTDPVNQDRAMNRDQKMGQGSSGTEQGRGSFGSTGSTGSGSKESGTSGSLSTGSTDSGSKGTGRGTQSGNRAGGSDRSKPDTDE